MLLFSRMLNKIRCDPPLASSKFMR
jgi:hypothetical protein